MKPLSNAPAGEAKKRDIITEAIENSGFKEDPQLRDAVKKLWYARLTRGLVIRAKLEALTAQENAPRKTPSGQ